MLLPLLLPKPALESAWLCGLPQTRRPTLTVRVVSGLFVDEFFYGPMGNDVSVSNTNVSEHTSTHQGSYSKNVGL